jgi:RNA polymerase primary sigma factor
MSKQYTAKDIEKILLLAKDTISLNLPVRDADNAADGEFGDFIVDQSPSVEEQVIENDIYNTLKESCAIYLRPREQRVIEMRFGIDDGVYKTLDEVAKHFGLTRERIRQIECRALKKLRFHLTKKNILGE